MELIEKTILYGWAIGGIVGLLQNAIAVTGKSSLWSWPIGLAAFVAFMGTKLSVQRLLGCDYAALSALVAVLPSWAILRAGINFAYPTPTGQGESVVRPR